MERKIEIGRKGMLKDRKKEDVKMKGGEAVVAQSHVRCKPMTKEIYSLKHIMLDKRWTMTWTS